MAIHPAASVACCALLAAGCLAPPSGGAGQSDVQAPVWRVGDSWHYVDPATGRWENATVEAREPRSGFDAYRVRWERNWTDASGAAPSVEWVDARTLGVLAGTQEDGSSFRFSAPMFRVFPLAPQRYNSTLSASGLHVRLFVDSGLAGWNDTAVPAGFFAAVTIQADYRSDMPGCFGDAKGDVPPGKCSPRMQLVYAPRVGNLLVDSAGFRLAAWRGPS